MKEHGSCLHPFVRRIQSVLSKNGTKDDLLDEIEFYRKRAEVVYKDTYFIHRLAVSRISLEFIILYETLRFKTAFPLPDSRKIIDKITPLKARSEHRLLNQPPDDPRHLELANIMKAEKVLSSAPPSRLIQEQKNRDRL